MFTLRPTLLVRRLALLFIGCGLAVGPARAWDYAGHHAVNELALASLPSDFPDFLLTPTARARIAYLAGEPDRWRNQTNTPLKHASAPDHYFDLEEIYDYHLTPDTLPMLRYDFVAELISARTLHPEQFPRIDLQHDSAHTRVLPGFLPWTIEEYYEKLKSGFSTLNALQSDGGTPEEITNEQQNIIYVMGVMGHFVGDASQPLHTTVYFNGWTPDKNPHGYTTRRSFHSWIDGGFFGHTGGIVVSNLVGSLHPASVIPQANTPDGIFRASVKFIVEANQLVEPLYQLEKDGKLNVPETPGHEGRKFLDAQLVKSGQLLGDLWYTAWKEAPEDTYLERELEQRAGGGTQ